MLALDSDTAVEVLRGRNLAVAARYLGTSPADIVLPSIVAGELMVGAVKSIRSSAVAELEGFLASHKIVPFGEPEFRLYATVRADLERRGLKIGNNDTIIAATTLAAGATLVTHNTREFSRVPGLSLVDWQV